MLSDTALREAFSHFPQGVVLIAAAVDGAPQGLVASTFTVGVSLEPPLVSVAVQHSSETWPLLAEQAQLGVSLLGREQSGIARQLASKDRENRFRDVAIETHESGAVSLPTAPARMVTRIHGQMRAGDHDVVLLEVLSVESIPGAEAIVFHRSAFKDISPRDLPA